jgi:hypothetical protein
MKGIYEVGRWNGLRYRDMLHTKSHKDWFRNSEVVGKGCTHTDIGDLISLRLFLQNKESRLNVDINYEELEVLATVGMQCSR